MSSAFTRRRVLTALAALPGAACLLASRNVFAAEPGVAIPAPLADLPAKSAKSATAVFAGGCFWGVQGVFQHVAGVTEALSGYAGGDEATAAYLQVDKGTTGHAESVRVTYDPHVVSYGKLLQIFFSVAHNPTQLNRQGPDTGTQYRSAIFPVDNRQAAVARAYIAQLNKARVFDGEIVTKIELRKTFYRAEEGHQNFMTLYPTNVYIATNDLPKVAELKKYFPNEFREEPRLVSIKAK